MLIGRRLNDFLIVIVLSLGTVTCTSNPVRISETHQQVATPNTSPVANSTAERSSDIALRHQEEDRLWASRASLTTDQVRRLRLISNVSDDEAAYIVNLDTQNLRNLGHVLLVTAGGNGHCLELFVFERKADDFKLFWSNAQTPNAAGFCRESPKDPVALATLRGTIVVKIPVFDYNKRTEKTAKIFTYKWNGRSYQLSSAPKSADG